MNYWKKIGNNIWEYKDELRMPGGVFFSLRSVAVLLTKGDIWLHSPCDFPDGAIIELKTLGDVRYIVAPNTFHHLFVAKTALNFPKAEIWCARGVSKKQEKLEMDGELTRSVPWSQEIETLPLEGAPSLNETVFFHHESKSFICTDFIFNIHSFKNLRTKFLMTLMGANKKFAQSRAWRFIGKDKALLAQGTTEILSWNFDRVVMGHGQILETPDAKEHVLNATAWLRKGLLLE